MTYPGGKSQAGVGQWIINHMPPHAVYIEAFLGSGAVLKMKRPAVVNIGIDADEHVVNAFRDDNGHVADLYVEDAIEWLRGYDLPFDALVYCDPPYLMGTRLSQRRRYRCEMTDAQHAELLDVLKSLTCMVMISGYMSELYLTELAGWRTDCLRVRTRGGAWATEWLWMNFAEPFELAEYTYLGSNFRERERIKRKKARWTRRLSEMPMLERACLIEAVDGLRDTCPTVWSSADRHAKNDDGSGVLAADDGAHRCRGR